MIYILSEAAELKFAQIWVGHHKLIREMLQRLHVRYLEINLESIPTNLIRSDVVINIGNHQYVPSELLQQSGDRLAKCNFIGIIDDYTTCLPTQFRNSVRGTLIANIKNPPLHLKSFDWVVETFYLNINRASYNPLPLQSGGEGGIYWGSFRSKRTRYFDKYIKKEMTVSASGRAHNKFSEYYNYRAIDKINIPEDLQQFGHTVYIHDVGQPAQSPANRFYEAISAGLPIFFDVECVRDFEGLPFEVDPWIVEDRRQIENFDLAEVQKSQRKYLCRDYHTELLTDTEKIFEDLLL